MPEVFRGLEGNLNETNRRYIGSRAADWTEKNVLPKVQEIAESETIAGGALRTLGWLGKQQERIPGYKQAEEFLTQKGASGAKKFNIDPRIGMMAGMLAMPGVEDLIPGGDALKIASKTRKGAKLTKIASKGVKESVIGGKAARRIQGGLHLPTPKKIRADSFKPNLPQNVVDDYIADSTQRLRSGQRNRKDVPYLIDNDGEIFRMDQKGWVKEGDISQKKYALISQRLKNARNAQVAGVRQQKVNLNTAPGTDQRDFYYDPDVKVQHNPKVEDAHHRRILDSEAKLRRGLSKRENRILDGYFAKRGAGEGGNSRFNRDNLPKKVHKALHSWQTRFKKATGADVTELTLSQRKKYIDQFIEDLKYSDVKTYRLMQNHLKRQSLKLPKKTEPTQWSDFRARNIKRDVELFGQAEWKVGDAKVTWYPNKNNPLKGRGQIDILEQAGKTNPKGVKALIKDFDDSLKDFPSGVKVELNPKWKDAKRRSIYENYIFKNNPNIKRNADPTLGWVYTAP